MENQSKMQQALSLAYDKLQKELEKEPLSPERVAALINVIKTLDEIKP